MFALKPIKFTYMETKIFESSFSPSEELQILGMLFTPTSPLNHPWKCVVRKTLALEFATLKRGGDLS
jgi:hypothetical protein